MSNLEAIRKNVKPADILLTRKYGDPISVIVGGVTKSNWSHALMYINDEKILESHWDGVRIKPLSRYLNGDYEVGLFRVTPEINELQAKKVVKAARKLLGIHYGFLQLLWQFILRICGKSEDPDFSIDVDRGMICTEVVATAYEKIGIRFKDLPPHQMEPVDFDESPITVRIA